ncbi:hypothetical protein BDK51DRAFT_30750 [Blyttiomyces helicus]|uniref:Uncharacterized protein n=1 Tax=Blyttiomyces helicus TaxID=388810 RepID=A0A4P9WGL6_9FUNG|nr:hypothetical protein BDK51DRAFT_30750 [Blyttiomyces helicus]|eukprot:RKO90963.1 hypothetical protein BDK51DRAFT_30750 [Blyttiomyces helicus]
MTEVFLSFKEVYSLPYHFNQKHWPCMWNCAAMQTIHSASADSIWRLRFDYLEAVEVFPYYLQSFFGDLLSWRTHYWGCGVLRFTRETASKYLDKWEVFPHLNGYHCGALTLVACMVHELEEEVWPRDYMDKLGGEGILRRGAWADMLGGRHCQGDGTDNTGGVVLHTREPSVSKELKMFWTVTLSAGELLNRPWMDTWQGEGHVRRAAEAVRASSAAALVCPAIPGVVGEECHQTAPGRLDPCLF